jgi:Ribbon-helix-helix protein, copG family
MSKLVQARLDDETDRILKALGRRTGLSDSELVRQGLRALAESSPAWGAARVVGVGRFSSDVPDLGSNRVHLAGFGRK